MRNRLSLTVNWICNHCQRRILYLKYLQIRTIRTHFILRIRYIRPIFKKKNIGKSSTYKDNAATARLIISCLLNFHWKHSQTVICLIKNSVKTYFAWPKYCVYIVIPCFTEKHIQIQFYLTKCKYKIDRHVY